MKHVKKEHWAKDAEYRDERNKCQTSLEHRHCPHFLLFLPGEHPPVITESRYLQIAPFMSRGRLSMECADWQRLACTKSAERDVWVSCASAIHTLGQACPRRIGAFRAKCARLPQRSRGSWCTRLCSHTSRTGNAVRPFGRIEKRVETAWFQSCT